MKAELVRHERIIDELGNLIEIKMWKFLMPSSDKPHGYKYSLVYIEGDSNIRVIGYDNAEGKGDHRHIRGSVKPYKFRSLKKLAHDFYGDIELYKRGEI